MLQIVLFLSLKQLLAQTLPRAEVCPSISCSVCLDSLSVLQILAGLHLRGLPAH